MGWLQPLRAVHGLPPPSLRRLAGRRTPPWVELPEGLQSQRRACVACRAFATSRGTTATATSSPISPPLPFLSSSYTPSPTAGPRLFLSSPASSSLLHTSSSSPSPRISRLTGRSPLRLPRRLAASTRFCSAMCRSRAGLEGSSVAVQARELLPANVVPRHYHLTVDTDFDKLTYKGTVVIDLDVAETSNSVSLHTLELEIHSAKLTSGGQAVR
jgi:hypothetical protein